MSSPRKHPSVRKRTSGRFYLGLNVESRIDSGLALGDASLDEHLRLACAELGQREVARKLGVSRMTLGKALGDARAWRGCPTTAWSALEASRPNCGSMRSTRLNASDVSANVPIFTRRDQPSNSLSVLKTTFELRIVYS
jgi:hypothetical protein